MSQRVNVADRLAELAAERPDQIAVAASQQGGWDQITFAEINHDATQLAQGLVAMGVKPGHRMALLVKPSVEFVTLVFALLRSGATMVLVDSGLGVKNIVRCLHSTQPDGFVGIPQAHVLRVLKRGQFPKARLNVTVGRRWFWGGETLETLRKLAAVVPPSPTGRGIEGGGEAGDSTPTLSKRARELPHTTADDTAAIVFTSGSTGPPKGVLYRHETFDTQANEIQRQYGIQPGGVDLACFPLFGLFNVACGVTTVLPEMDFSRPASCDPEKLFRAANHWQVTQAFASPAVWDRLSQHAERSGDTIPTLRKVFSCGAPVPAKVIRRTLRMVHPDAELHTPYGATESLPVATIEAQEILNETAEKTDQGAGVCVGRKFESIEWRIIRITDDPIATIDQIEELPQGEIGELIVRGPQVSREYLTQPEASASGSNNHNQLAKITDGDQIWHRLGDVGYFDDEGRYWYCGRKSHRVKHPSGDLFTEKIENVFNTLPNVGKSALVGVKDRPVLVVEELSSFPSGVCWDEWASIEPMIEKLWYGNGSLTEADNSFTEFPRLLSYGKPLPTDIRHNSKINRELLAKWAAKKLEH